MNYRCLKQQEFFFDEYRLLPLRHQDMRAIKEWRNAQMLVLRQTQPLTDQMQELYYKEVIEPSFLLKQPLQVLFSLLKQESCIGYGGLVHINWASHKEEVSRAEVSFLLETERSQDAPLYRKEFSIFLELIKKIAFDELHLYRLFTETFDIRPLHLSVLEENGFIYEGRLKEHVRIGNQFVDALIHGCINPANGALHG